MTDETKPRKWRRWLLLAGVLVGVFILYPQLMDLGSELYRAFS